ncbi:MAG: transcriptional repressor [Nitrospirae bacterium]|nr:transcriptional repressor [Nitrospirota bacterium]
MPWRNGTGPPWLQGKFRGCGYRLTMPRQIILDVLSKTTDHLSAEEIYMTVHKVYPAIGLTTVYRTLELLVQMGLVFKFDFGDGRARYELSEGPKSIGHHHHLICTGCRRIIDYTDFIDEEIELLKRTEKGLSKKYNFKISNHLIQFYGLCEKCKGKG